MSELIHVYCDESCHLENDQSNAMVVGAIWCNASHRTSLSRKVKELKKTFGLAPHFEIKWVKVSPAKLDFYIALLDLFFDEPMLHFRGLVVPDKNLLDHEKFRQSHDEFYYKMWYLLLNPLINSTNQYRIFLDIKDTRGQTKVQKLHDILCSANNDGRRQVVQSIELVHSHDVILLQLADLLIGAMGYTHRELTTSSAKQALVTHIRQRSGLRLKYSSAKQAEKFNLFVWRPQS
jgi:hypothetical protein